MSDWAKEALPECAAWQHELVTEELSRREKRIAELKGGLEAATEIINSHCQHIAELEVAVNLSAAEADTYLTRASVAEAQLAELKEALESMVDMVEMNGFGKAYAMDLARAALKGLE